MTDTLRNPAPPFAATRCWRSGPLAEVAMAVKQALEQGTANRF